MPELRDKRAYHLPFLWSAILLFSIHWKRVCCVVHIKASSQEETLKKPRSVNDLRASILAHEDCRILGFLAGLGWVWLGRRTTPWRAQEVSEK